MRREKERSRKCRDRNASLEMSFVIHFIRKRIRTFVQ